jgi:hypothetical protein
MAEVTSHPVHLVNRAGRLMPSAFIPFCFFGPRILGRRIANFSLPVCDQFRPVILHGDLCYRIDINITDDGAMQNGIGNSRGLMLELDYNFERGLVVTLG